VKKEDFKNRIRPAEMLQWNKAVHWQMHMYMLLEWAIATEAKLALVLFEITARFEQDQSLFGFGGYGSSRHVHYDIHAFTVHVFLLHVAVVVDKCSFKLQVHFKMKAPNKGMYCVYTEVQT